MEYVVSTLVTGILFLSLILLLAAKPKISKKITIGALTVAGVSGLLIYGYGYMAVTNNFCLAVLKALLAVCGSFVGKNEYSAISSAPFMDTMWMQILCTFIQICALYATASAVITSIGTEALKKLRLWLARRGKLNLIYGINANALEFGKALVDKKQGVVVFVAEQATPAAAAAIPAMGCVLQTDTHAVNANCKFLRSIGFRRSSRSLTLYALDNNSTSNIRYASNLLNTLKSCHIEPERLRLVISGQEEVAVSRLQLTAEQYGYGFVTAVNEPQMAARMLMLKHPACETISFDQEGKACENFEALLIGFGQVGQAVLKTIVMNGQFEGSTFRLDVFAPDCKSADGSFANQFGPLCKAYDIFFHDHDARSRQMYEHLNDRRDKLKYIAICTGSEKLNHEIAEDLTAYFHNSGRSAPIFTCSRSGIDAYVSDGTVAISHSLYGCELLCTHDLDRMAMILNHRYHAPSERTALQNWMECDYFSRQSCRAAADFVPAMLRAAGKTPAQVVDGDWNLTDAQKENLSKTEHLRWCAFHYCMGFSAMDTQEFDARAAIYLRQMEQNGKASIRIGKNMQGRTHACLIGWDELDRLSEKEASITGKYTDYKAMDTENVLAIPQLLQSAKEGNVI